MTLEKIMDSASPLWGACPFDSVKGRLIDCRAKSRLPEEAKTVIVACFPYLLSEDNYRDINISKYAVVTDYHEVVMNILAKACEKLSEIYPSEKFKAFADNSPIPEVDAACKAGLGVKGKNTLLITEKYGSYVFIGEIVTTLDVGKAEKTVKNCIGCGRCIKACPSGALENDTFQKNLCLSHITQKKGVLSNEEEQLMKACGCVWGCDICQDICPMNKNAQTTDINAFLSSPLAHLEKGCALESRAYEWRGRNVIERNISLHNK